MSMMGWKNGWHGPKQRAFPATHISIDPGIGFGKTFRQNLDLLAGFTLFHGLGLPLLVGLSRKGFVGALTGEKTAGNRVYRVRRRGIASGHGGGAYPAGARREGDAGGAVGVYRCLAIRIQRTFRFLLLRGPQGYWESHDEHASILAPMVCADAPMPAP